MSEASAGKYCYPYPRPAVTVDCVLFALQEGELQVLFIQRLNEPFKARWAFPGGFVEMNEGLEESARRELAEETGIKVASLEQLQTFGDPKRDPRGRVITVAYLSLVQMNGHTLRAASDARSVRWFPVRKLPPLAFDHKQILLMALKRLEEKRLCAPAILKRLPAKLRACRLKSRRTAPKK